MLKALIFDMDGTLADSDPIHLRAFAQVFAPYGVSLDHANYKAHIAGRTNPLIFQHFLPGETPQAHARLADEKERLFRDMAGDLEPLAGLTDLLAFAEAREIGLAVVTNAPRPNLEHMLQGLRLESRFTIQVAAEDVDRPKPDPLPYLTALRRLGIDASEAVAFEDSLPGLQAAKGAGLLTAGVLTSLSAQAMRDAGADLTVNDFQDDDLWRMLREGIAA